MEWLLVALGVIAIARIAVAAVQASVTSQTNKFSTPECSRPSDARFGGVHSHGPRSGLCQARLRPRPGGGLRSRARHSLWGSITSMLPASASMQRVGIR